jgi:RNA polymerase sigma-70 factor, ECF subfamily
MAMMERGHNDIDRQSTRSGAGPTDAALVVAARSGAEWAAEALFHRYAGMVNALAYRLVPWETEADDLVQDSFLYAFNKLEGLREPQAFCAWLKSITVRTATKRIRRRRLLSKLGLSTSRPVDLDAIVSPAAPPDATAELRKIYSRMTALNAEHRVSLILSRIEGWSIPEIARQTGVSEGTVKRRITRARCLLDEAEPKRSAR